VSTFWLCADERYLTDRIDFTSDQGADDVAIPVVMIQTGNSRSPLYPGIYREPRIRTYSDKFGTPTTLTTVKEITFAAVLGGKTMDEIFQKWQRIERYFDQAQIAASPFPRGSGVVLIEQINNATAMTYWDVISGVITDVDMNIPGTLHYAAVVQLSVLPFSRGTPLLGPADPASRPVGGGASYYLPNVPGDAPGIFELSLTDTTPTSSRNITWVFIGRRSYPMMAQADFTPWYPIDQVTNPPVLLSAAFQRVTRLFSNGGPQDTGLFGVWAVVNDGTVVVLPPTNIQTQAILGTGTIPNGFVEMALAPYDGFGRLGNVSARQVVSLQNPAQTGNVQLFEDFERNNLNSFASLPTYTVTGGGAAGIGVSPGAALRGFYGMFLYASSDATSGSTTEASIQMLMPPMTGTNAQSIAFLLYPLSWAGTTTVPPVLINTPTTQLPFAVVPPLAPPPEPTVSDAFIEVFPAEPMLFALTWYNIAGTTTLSNQHFFHGTGHLINVGIPPQPAGVTYIGVWVNFVNSGAWAVEVVTAPAGGGAFTYLFGRNIIQQHAPPSTNTTSLANFPPGTYNVYYTLLNQYGETGLSPVTPVGVSTQAGVQVTLPSFESLGATSARVYCQAPGTPYPTLAGSTTAGASTIAITPGDGVTLAPTSNTTGSPAAHDTFPRFTWGSVEIIPSPYQGIFFISIQPPTGSSFIISGSNFSLGLNQLHTIGVSFIQEGATGAPNLNGTYQVTVDGQVYAKYSGAIGSAISVPISATWGVSAIGQTPTVTERYLVDDISVFDEPLNAGFTLVNSGSAAAISWTPAPNTATVDLYYTVNITGSTVTPTWYRLAGVGTGLQSTGYTLTSTFVQGSQIVTGPPTAPPYSSYAQLQARVGFGSAPQRWLSKPIVRTAAASGQTELVKLGEIELPPGAKGEYRTLDPWELEVWVRAGGQSFPSLSVLGIILFPVDGEDEWGGIVAKAFGLSGSHTWTIGTNRWGRPYAQLFSGSSLVGYADVSGALSAKYGDNVFVVLTGYDDGRGNLLFDAGQTMLLSSKYTPRNHFQVVESAAT
jgi:hypothetical protein